MESARDLLEHELQAMYDATKRLSSGLQRMAKKASHPALSSKIQDLHKANQEQMRRLEEIFQLVGQKPSRSESKTVRGFLGDFATFANQEKPEKEPLDVYVAHAAADIAQYMMEGYEAMLLLAERSGATHATPKISDLLKVSTRETKKIGKDIQKLTDPLVEQLRPS
jgi:ferritin-like metal-binding protein YciE